MIDNTVLNIYINIAEDAADILVDGKPVALGKALGEIAFHNYELQQVLVIALAKVLRERGDIDKDTMSELIENTFEGTRDIVELITYG